ncbi:MAG: hypothetical protein M0Z51_01350 [Propionibacterium sp.]|nr:hypothetical protein [Propionibacterium sp.]
MERKHAQSGRSDILIGVVILVVGTLAAAGLSVGGPWWIRAGVLVVAAAGGLALWRAHAVLVAEREHSAAQAHRAVQEAVESERRHHHESMGTIVRFTARVSALRATIDTLTAERDEALAQLEQRDSRIATLTSTQATLLGNAAEMRRRIVDLEERIALFEVELQEVLASPEADILVLPRRLQITSRGAVSLPASDDAEFDHLDQAAGH